MPLVKIHHIHNIYGDDKLSKLKCQNCNEYVKCAESSGEILHIKCFRADMANLGIYI